MLSHFTNQDNHKDWPRYITFCQLAHDSAKHTILQASLSSLLMCRERKLLYYLRKPSPEANETDDGTYAQVKKTGKGSS